MSDINLNLEGIAPFILDEIAKGYYELPEKTLATKYFSNKDSVLELGSAIGYLGISVKKKFPDISWTSVEANPWCVNRSKENYSLNGLIGDIRHGVGSIDNDQGTMKFYVREEFWNSSLDEMDLEYSKTVEVIDCPVLNLNDLAAKANTLVIDIEGGEVNLIHEYGINLKQFDKVLIEFHARFTGEEYVARAIELIDMTHSLKEMMGEVYYFEKRK